MAGGGPKFVILQINKMLRSYFNPAPIPAKKPRKMYLSEWQLLSTYFMLHKPQYEMLYLPRQDLVVHFYRFSNKLIIIYDFGARKPFVKILVFRKKKAE